MMPENHTRISQAVADSSFDAVIAITQENVLYASGVLLITQKLFPDRLALVVWPRDGEPVLIVASIEETLARARALIPDIYTYDEPLTSPIECLAQVLEEKRLERGRLGVEVSASSYAYYDEMRSRLPDARFGDCDRLLARVRMVKTDEEVQLLTKAAYATDQAIRTAVEEAHPGHTEKAVADAMGCQLLRSGAHQIGWLDLGTGANARFSHPLPGPTRLEHGDLVRIDLGGIFSGYYTDLGRTVAVGFALQEDADTYRALVEIQRAVIDATRPGVSIGDLYELCRLQFEERHLVFEALRIGHSLGVGLHEYPMIEAGCSEEIRPNMVLNIEPRTITDRGDLLQIEDVIVVTDGDPTVVSRSADWDELFIIT